MSDKKANKKKDKVLACARPKIPMRLGCKRPAPKEEFILPPPEPVPALEAPLLSTLSSFRPEPDSIHQLLIGPPLGCSRPCPSPFDDLKLNSILIGPPLGCSRPYIEPNISVQVSIGNIFPLYLNPNFLRLN